MDRRGLSASYGGTRFRSHLEARWAIFFDGLSLKWEYEPQGFAMDGIAYLPDFAVYTAGGTTWAEVKPDWDADPAGIERWRAFAAVRPMPSRAALLCGKPSIDGTHTVIGGNDAQDNPLKGLWEDDGYRWRPCPSGYHFDLARGATNAIVFASDGCADLYGYGGDEQIAKAVQAALSHRFGKAE